MPPKKKKSLNPKKDNQKPPPKKRGRKPKPKSNEPKPPPKKRGRKPKGGKIIQKPNQKIINNTKISHNVILHLKCSKNVLNKNNNMLNPITNYNPEISNITSFSMNNNNKISNLNFQNFKNDTINNQNTFKSNESQKNNNIKVKSKNDSKPDDDIVNLKELWLKLDILKKKLKMNNVSDKKSSCFWCTYNFDNPAVYIPKKFVNGSYEVYGCFCSPECAVAYLKNENIDTSTLWERYCLLNNIYGKIYEYSKNIKPAPSPYYTLDKYYGNLNIQEYRKLLKNDKLLMIVDKPMTKILPELYEENNETPSVYNNLLTTKKTNNTSLDYRLKRNKISHSKNELLTSNFNF
tara:strand:- start:8 stop:1051 length:1044 start_codon:yes stop_codon:yes gene_type:complete